jgi:hypothetical protein
MDTLDEQVIRAITNSFGKDIWRRSLVVLTHAQLSPPDGIDYNDFFTKRSEALLRYIRTGAGINKREYGVMQFFHFLFNYFHNVFWNTKALMIICNLCGVSSMHSLSFCIWACSHGNAFCISDLGFHCSQLNARINICCYSVLHDHNSQCQANVLYGLHMTNNWT